jgi:hypothetical protein
MIPLLALVVFGLYVRRQAEAIRAEDLRPRLVVRMKLSGAGMASREEVRVRQSIEEGIEGRGIGTIADAGSSEGWATLQVAVDDPVTAAEQIRNLLHEGGLDDRAFVETPTAVP